MDNMNKRKKKPIIWVSTWRHNIYNKQKAKKKVNFFLITKIHYCEKDIYWY